MISNLKIATCFFLLLKICNSSAGNNTNSYFNRLYLGAYLPLDVQKQTTWRLLKPTQFVFEDIYC